MNARDAVLGRIRAAAAGGPTHRVHEVPRRYRPGGGPAGGSELLDLLEERLVDYTATVTRCTQAGLVEALLEQLRDVRSVAVPHGAPPAWVDALWTEGIDARVDGDPAPLDRTTLDATAAVVTGCRVAVAETGTIVLDGGPGQGRRVLSLLPDRHVCVVLADQVVAGVPDAVTVLGRDPTRPLTWISGPSATSDIELVRVDGVHGPRDLRVLLVTDPSPVHPVA